MSNFLALDVSTSCVGWATGNEDGIEDHGYVRLDKEKPDDWRHYDLVQLLVEPIEEQIGQADVVIVEDAAKKYGGMTTRRSITVLVEFNAVIRYEMNRRGKDVLRYHPNTARKESRLDRGIKPDSYDDTKQWILDAVSDEFGIEWSTTRYDNIRKQHEDEADAIVLGSAYVEQQ